MERHENENGRLGRSTMRNKMRGKKRLREIKLYEA